MSEERTALWTRRLPLSIQPRKPPHPTMQQQHTHRGKGTSSAAAFSGATNARKIPGVYSKWSRGSTTVTRHRPLLSASCRVAANPAKEAPTTTTCGADGGGVESEVEGQEEERTAPMSRRLFAVGVRRVVCMGEGEDEFQSKR